MPVIPRHTGKTRSEGRATRSTRSRLAACEARFNAENPAIRSHPRSINLGHEAGMAAMPQPGRQAAVGGFWADMRQSLMTVWAHKRFGVLIFLICALLLFCYFLSSGADNQYVEETSFWEAVSNFFFPTTCIIREDQEVKACNEKQNLNKGECLRLKCCYSPFRTDLRCFAPLRDKPLQMVRIFGFGVISMIILACLPIYCCSLFWRSRWANPLQRKVNRMLKGLKKQRKKVKTHAEMSGATMKEEAFFSR